MKQRVRLRRRLADEEGSATAEYAIATMAAVGFAGLLVVILRSNEVRALLLDIIRNALSI
jgi:Flp pilus assembly pilin Flp